MRTRNILIVSRNTSVKAKLSIQFQECGFNILCTDLSEFDPAVLDFFQVRLAIVDRPERLPGGAYLMERLASFTPAVTIVHGYDGTQGSTPVVPTGSSVCDLGRPAADVRREILNLLYPAKPGKKRGLDRVTISHEIFWTLSDAANPIMSQIRDLSPRGASIYSANELPRSGDVLEFHLKPIGGEAPVRSLSLVRWVKPVPEGGGEFGIEFLTLNEEHEDALDQMYTGGELKLTS